MSVPADGATAFERAYESTSVTLRRARHDLLDWLASVGVTDPARAERVVLVLSELASNAVAATPGGQYRVSARLVAADRVAVEVRNAADDPLPVASLPDDIAPSARQGRGLAIVRSLADHLDIRRHGRDIVVAALVRVVPLRGEGVEP